MHMARKAREIGAKLGHERSRKIALATEGLGIKTKQGRIVMARRGSWSRKRGLETTGASSTPSVKRYLQLGHHGLKFGHEIASGRRRYSRPAVVVARPSL